MSVLNVSGDTLPNPGSREAIALGCLCPVLDNRRGTEPPFPATDTEPAAWYVDRQGPVHPQDERRRSEVPVQSERHRVRAEGRLATMSFEVGQTAYTRDGDEVTVMEINGPIPHFGIRVLHDTGEEGWMNEGNLSAEPPQPQARDAEHFIEWCEKLLGRSIPQWQQRHLIAIYGDVEGELMAMEFPEAGLGNV